VTLAPGGGRDRLISTTRLQGASLSFASAPTPVVHSRASPAVKIPCGTGIDKNKCSGILVSSGTPSDRAHDLGSASSIAGVDTPDTLALAVVARAVQASHPHPPVGHRRSGVPPWAPSPWTAPLRDPDDSTRRPAPAPYPNQRPLSSEGTSIGEHGIEIPCGHRSATHVCPTPFRHRSAPPVCPTSSRGHAHGTVPPTSCRPHHLRRSQEGPGRMRPGPSYE